MRSYTLDTILTILVMPAHRPALGSSTMTLLVFAAALGLRARRARRRGGRHRAPVPRFSPVEQVFSLRRQRVFRKGIVTDLTHLLVNNTFVTIGAIALAVVGSLPLIWLRRFDVESLMPGVRRGHARGRARVRRELLGSPSDPHGAAALAVPQRAPQHRGDGLGGGRPPASARLRVHPGVRDRPAVRPRLRRGRVRRRGCVRHAPRDLPARQRAVALSRRPVDRPDTRVAPLAPRDRRRGTRQELRAARRRPDLRHRTPAEGTTPRRASAPTTPSRRGATSATSRTRSPKAAEGSPVRATQ